MKIPVRSNDDSHGKMREDTDKADAKLNKKFDANANDLEVEQENFPHYKRVSDYLLGSCIGEGSFAKVRVGFHCPTKEKVAIKVINKAKAKKDSYVYKNLHREGKIMQMMRHPNIVQVFDILETGNNYYLVTELCTGGELIEIVTEKGSLPETTVRRYTSQLVHAVAYLHDKNIVHRDLKVENILLDSEDNIKIIDFGLSNTLTQEQRHNSCPLTTQCGSPAYAAPELLAKKPYGPKVDVWSIGVITFALLAGKLPFTVEPFNIPKLCSKMQRGEMNPIPASVSTQCRIFIRKLLQPYYPQRPSISEVGRMKWVANCPSIDKHLRTDLSFSRRYSVHTPTLRFNSLVIKEMESSLGFSCVDIIQCVQKNRPGPALTTYHLLLRKKLEEKAKKRASKHLVNDIRHQIDAEVKDKAVKSETPVKEMRLGVAAPVEKVESFRKENNHQDTSYDASQNHILSPRRDAVEATKGADRPSAVAASTPQNATVGQREIGLRIDIAPEHTSKKSEKCPKELFSAQHLEASKELASPPVVRRGDGTEVKNLIANMRRNREALEKKQRVGQKAESKTEDVTKVRDVGDSPYKEALWTTDRPFRPLSIRRPNPKSTQVPSRPSTTGQTHSTEDEIDPVSSPRPLSQNGAAAKRPSKVFAHRRSLFSQASAKPSRYTPDWLKYRGEEKVHTALPAIVNKESQTAARPFARTLFPSTSRDRDTRHSLPAHVPSGGVTVSATNRTRNGTTVREQDHLVVNRTKLGYYVTKNDKVTSPPVSRPKKVISEPIAAAISYLTSSKNRNARRDKMAY